MNSFVVGEEVLYNGSRYVITSISGERPYHYHLLASSPNGVKFAWSNKENLKKIASYTKPVRDYDSP